jgi:hypothetical protein
MQKKLLLIGFSLIVSLSSSAQTFNGSPGLIHDYNGTAIPAYYHCTVSGLPSSIDSSFGLERICLNITHTYDGDLEIKLMSPDSFIVMLSNRRGGSGHNFTGTCFRGHGSNSMVSLATAPFTGEFDPDGDLALFLNGMNPNGTWSLIVTDLAAADSGTVDSFSLVFGADPSPHSVLPCGSNDVTLCQCPDGTQDCDLLPDMTASAAALLNGSYESNDTVYVNNATPNIGWGPLEIHGVNSCWCDTVQVPCTTTVCPGSGLPPKQLVEQTVYHKSQGTLTTWTRPAGTMTYHPSHGHIHVDNWASYTLRRPVYGLTAPDWPVIGLGGKQSYCLVNLGSCSTGNGYCIDTSGTVLGQADIPNHGLGSVTGCGYNQGIFVADFDVYSQYLSGQWIVLDSLCNGEYYLVSITDPNNAMLETNENNNWAAAPFTLTQQLNLPFPSVNFTYTASGNTITFINGSSDYDSLRWDLGDGVTTTGINPIHTYCCTGTYTVILTAYNHCGFEQQVVTFTITMVGITEAMTPDVFNFKVYPNPAAGKTKIDFNISKRSPVTLQLFDAIGNLVQTLADEPLNMGSHHYVIDPAELNLSRGVYTVRLTSAESNFTQRIVFMK